MSRKTDKRVRNPRMGKRQRGVFRGVPLFQGVPLFRRLRLRPMRLRPLSGPRVSRRGRRGRGRDRRGAGALLGVLLLASLAGAALAVHYETRAAERAVALDRAAGRVFAGWVQAAHRATQAHADAFEAAFETQLGIVLTVARLRALGAAPPDLPERPGRDAAMTLGVIPDGTLGPETARGIPGRSAGPGRSPVPMAFGVLEPRSRPTAMRAGALDAGLAALAPGGGTLMEAHRPAIEGALGRPLAADALWVTADLGLRYRERALHRRAQPGRPWLNRMETTLRMAPPGATDPADPARRDVVDAGDVDAEVADIGTDIAVGGNADIGGGAATGDATARTVEAGDIAAPTLEVIADLLVGGAVTGALAAGRVKATDRLEAGALRTEGVLDAASLSAATAAAVGGAAAARELAGEKLTVSGVLGAGRGAAGGGYGPDATIGVLTVGSCAGCEGE
ncbi:MAG: hypothetical protein OXC15_06870 [Rhodospirillaceae bacterium]|nr:hypothetical protein [Rhodospirillaceae bacterium]